MIKNKQVGVSETAYGESLSSRNYWKNHRNKLDDLYPSERYFLEPVIKCSKSVLDVGCAAGGSFDFCLEAKSNIDYTGIDISKELINIARELHPTGDFFVFDGHEITLENKKVDLVFSIGVLHHLHHWRNMIKQMVNFSSKFTIFDLRLSSEDTLDNAIKYYQKVTFDGKWKSKTVISYLVVNIDEFKNFMKQCFGSSRYRVESYGYYAKPTGSANIPYDKVFMCCIKVEKNSKSPGIFIDISD
jgi:SAM-dependent methyltransferase